MAYVHQHCLQTWIEQNAMRLSHDEALCCRICAEPYTMTSRTSTAEQVGDGDTPPAADGLQRGLLLLPFLSCAFLVLSLSAFWGRNTLLFLLTLAAVLVIWPCDFSSVIRARARLHEADPDYMRSLDWRLGHSLLLIIYSVGSLALLASVYASYLGSVAYDGWGPVASEGHAAQAGITEKWSACYVSLQVMLRWISIAHGYLSLSGILTHLLVEHAERFNRIFMIDPELDESELFVLSLITNPHVPRLLRFVPQLLATHLSTTEACRPLVEALNFFLYSLLSSHVEVLMIFIHIVLCLIGWVDLAWMEFRLSCLEWHDTNVWVLRFENIQVTDRARSEDRQ